MCSENFLTINGESISTQKVIQCLLVARKFKPVIKDILDQYIIEQELAANNDFKIDLDEIKQALTGYLINQKLDTPEKIQKWLSNYGLTPEDFFNEFSTKYKTDKLKQWVVKQCGVNEYFLKNKKYLDKVILSRIVSNKQGVVEEIYDQLVEGVISFDLAVRKYSIYSDRFFEEIMMKPESYGRLADQLRALINAAKPGDFLEPFDIDGLWYLYKFEQFLEASLDNELIKKVLEDEIFGIWLRQKRDSLTVSY